MWFKGGAAVLFSILIFSCDGEEDLESNDVKERDGSSSSIFSEGYDPAKAVKSDTEYDPYMPADSIGQFIYKIEKYFGMDKATTIANNQKNCDQGFSEFCFKLAIESQQNNETFAAENYYHLACRYGNLVACQIHMKLLKKRRKFESKLLAEKEEYSESCSEGDMASCASFSYTLRYFGEDRKADEVDLKACEMGYPASCLSLAKAAYQKRDFIRAEKLKRKAQKMLGLKDVVVDKINGEKHLKKALPTH